MQLNNGILQRRHSNWTGAMAHFDRAQAIEPGYCEPDFWRGLTLINSNRRGSRLTYAVPHGRTPSLLWCYGRPINLQRQPAGPHLSQACHQNLGQHHEGKHVGRG